MSREKSHAATTSPPASTRGASSLPLNPAPSTRSPRATPVQGASTADVRTSSPPESASCGVTVSDAGPSATKSATSRYQTPVRRTVSAASSAPPTRNVGTPSRSRSAGPSPSAITCASGTCRVGSTHVSSENPAGSSSPAGLGTRTLEPGRISWTAPGWLVASVTAGRLEAGAGGVVVAVQEAHDPRRVALLGARDVEADGLAGPHAQLGCVADDLHAERRCSRRAAPNRVAIISMA